MLTNGGLLIINYYILIPFIALIYLSLLSYTFYCAPKPLAERGRVLAEVSCYVPFASIATTVHVLVDQSLGLDGSMFML